MINKKCGNKFWNPNSCKCEYREKAARFAEECEKIIDNKTVTIKNKTNVSRKKQKTIKQC